MSNSNNEGLVLIILILIRIERDNFLNELFRQLEIDFLRYPVYEKYYKDILKKRIQENIKEHIYTN